MAVIALAAGCQRPGANCTASIDWVNFIEVGATQYVAEPASSPGLTAADLGAVYARVRFKVSGNTCDPNYRPKDGDAAFLAAGTPIYAVRGHPPEQELAARFQGRIVLYMSRSAAPTGFPISGIASP